jgi:hypothetical protein
MYFYCQRSFATWYNDLGRCCADWAGAAQEISMDITLTIRGPLAESLRRLATQRGVSVEALGEEVVIAGLVAVAPTGEGDSETLYLGSLALPPTHPLRLRLPIVAHGPIPQYTVEILPPPAAGSHDAD